MCLCEAYLFLSVHVYTFCFHYNLYNSKIYKNVDNIHIQILWNIYNIDSIVVYYHTSLRNENVWFLIFEILFSNSTIFFSIFFLKSMVNIASWAWLGVVWLTGSHDTSSKQLSFKSVSFISANFIIVCIIPAGFDNKSS